ncbi:MAG: hypothetical protein EOS25_07365 [Mesorhizobium sp.]|uniref:hypothetical protein n=1 Tax=Mesorhizobium sp. TaxID=1871066 RepID=UPI000FE4ED4A|nr:hypothetical protein [Mesorhizobium sp.]RWD50402.1 MAG: hypothetical protein EOS59_09750 [Mesorhizobium sp.]RWE62843.1 MAG: hypothetical protein EOS24_04265 [Mesorhizobium sp.]RWF10440.1 MAG: hypothetical protein EOS69_13685 [Mesorhizobium sp.]RWF20665.1 MAG: hypothetical protein EOS25_07365 [Mesorhizobium sp.]
MGKVIYFPRTRARAYAPKGLHSIRLRVLDDRNPSYTRWKAQFHVQSARGFPALKGFTDANARRHRWHSFAVKTGKLPAFTRGMQSMVNRGVIEMRIDGKAVGNTIRRRA